MKEANSEPLAVFVLADIALVQQQKDLELLLAKPSSIHNGAEIQRLRALKDRVDAALLALNGMAVFARHVSLAIAAYQANMLDEEVDLTNRDMFRHAVEPFRVDAHV